MTRTTVTATFCGTSTILVDDGRTSLLVDGFFTRPSLRRVALGRIAPDPARIGAGLARAGVTTLDAVLVAHSHHDHAMDAPVVVQQAGGTLHGSESTLNVARGAGLAEDRMHLVAHADTVVVGDFTVTVHEGRHSPGDRFPGTIDAPLRTPAKASAYRTGACFSFEVAHPDGTLLIHPSAGFVPGAYDDLQADVVYLGVGALGAQEASFQDDYWRHVVEASGARLVVPVHWDDFFRPLDRPLRGMPFFLDRSRATREVVRRKAEESGVAWRYPQAFERLQPFDTQDR